jgi:hypothetical protein
MKKKNETPILFSEPMVLKILSGEKKVTRRIVNPQPPDYIDYFKFYASEKTEWYFTPAHFAGYLQSGDLCAYPSIKAKYTPGGRLWVRETWGIAGYSNNSGYEISVKYRADNMESGWIDLDNKELWERLIYREAEFMKTDKFKHHVHLYKKRPILWRPSIFIPRAASRFLLDIVDVKIERLHELDDDEAGREGFKDREDFIKFWNSKNGRGGFPWAANPWVYRIEFKGIR